MEIRAVISLVVLLAASVALAATVYKWTDEEGVVHYSDVPHEGAEPIDLGDYNRLAGVRIAPPRDDGDASEEQLELAGVRYERLDIASPGAEETLWNIEGVLNVSLTLEPGLQAGHRVRIYLDGTPRLVPGTTFQLDEVFRGEHNLQAEIIDEAGQLMIRSQINRFYVQQSSVLRRRAGT